MEVVTVEELVEEVREAADKVETRKEYWRNNTSICKNDEDRESMMQMCEDDANMLYVYADLLKEGDYAAADKQASHMDTACREHIPDRAYYFVQRKVDEAYRKEREAKQVEQEVEVVLKVKVKKDPDRTIVSENFDITVSLPEYLGKVIEVSKK